MKKYNSWPLGKLPEDFRRTEPEQIRKMGYKWDDPRDIVDIFEEKVASFAGSKYGVAVDCCSNAIFLCLQYLLAKKILFLGDDIVIPRRTYISVPMQILHAGLKVRFNDVTWSGAYRLNPTNIYDSAVRWTEDMYIPDSLMCVSFQIKKKVPIGRGGMVLTDDKDAYTWLKLASYDGRDLTTNFTDKNHFHMIGWHMYMTPEDAARGILLMDKVPPINADWGTNADYIDVSKAIRDL